MPVTLKSTGAESDLSIALIGPDEDRRRDVSSALSCYQGGRVREFLSFPPDLDLLPEMLQQHYDVVIIDLDSDPDYALRVVETICTAGDATVMVYSAKVDLDMALRAMRAGAREFLQLPLVPAELAQALSRVVVRAPAANGKRVNRKTFVFLGSKGGCGVTTIAANFAVLLAQETEQSTLLIDLGLPLGDAALNLGMITEYSTANVFDEPNRLDASFLSSLLARHSTGLAVLAAPSEFPRTEASREAIEKLLTVARQNFDYVVVDVGTRLDLRQTNLFDDSTFIYLVVQAGISDLRNANRMISKFYAGSDCRLQIVLNRYIPNAMGFDDKNLAKALTRDVDWKIPDDYATARRTKNTATPIALEDSSISRVIRQMAMKAGGVPEKKRKSGLLGSLWPFSREIESAEPSES
jgi:pilus assembly protein CpaE